MQPSLRHDAIVTLLETAGELTVDALAEQLGVSRETIRRDLSRLDTVGKLRKFHGGARSLGLLLPEIDKESPFTQRMAQNADAKKRIAQAASRLFSAEDSLFVDTGSTTVIFAEWLKEAPPLVVVTNSSKIAAILSANPAHDIFLIGGAYGADAAESLGPLALEQIGKFRVRHAVITVGAIDTTGVMDFNLQEAEVAKAMIGRADRVIVLADHSKFDRPAVFEVVPLSIIDTLVTDRVPTKKMQEAFEAAGIDLVVAGEN